MEEEEISDEEVEISETKDSKRRVVLCRELSDLVTLVRVEASIDLFSAVSHRKCTFAHFHLVQPFTGPIVTPEN